MGDEKKSFVRVCEGKGPEGLFGNPPKVSRQFEWPKEELDPKFQEHLKHAMSAQNEYLICPCAHEMRVRNPRKLKGRLELASLPGCEHKNSACRRFEARKQPPISHLGKPDPCGEKNSGAHSISLRLENSEDKINGDFDPPVTETAGECMSRSVSSKSLRGLLGYIGDLSGLSEYSPDRPCDPRLPELAERMRHTCERTSALKRFFPKIVFGSLALNNLPDAISGACKNQHGAPRNLLGRALLINVQEALILDPLLELDCPYTTMYFAMSVERSALANWRNKLTAAEIENQERWKMLRYPQNHPGEAFLQLMALVEPTPNGVANEFRVLEIGWSLMDKRGLLYESTAEFETGAQLVTAGIRYMKPAGTFYSGGSIPRKPDFLVYDRDNSVFIIETDVGDGKTPRKILRDADLLRAGVKFISWNPFNGLDLVTTLKKVGFNW